jgi:hypothetical protein
METGPSNTFEILDAVYSNNNLNVGITTNGANVTVTYE